MTVHYYRLRDYALQLSLIHIYAGFMKMAVQGFQGPQNETALAGRHLSGQNGEKIGRAHV